MPRRRVRSAIVVLALVGTISAVPLVHHRADAGPSPVVGLALSDARGYWLASADGGVTTNGDAAFYGSAAGQRPTAPIVGIAATPDGAGYWLVASDGGIFSFGDAHFYGSTGAIRLNRPIVGMTSTKDGAGYWLVASDGGIFSFGDAQFFGSTGAIRLNRPVVGMAADPATGGYWMVASDGGIFSFHAPFWGSTGNLRLARPIVGMAAVPDGGGYRFAASDGGIFDFGDASYFGSLAGATLSAPVVGLGNTPSGSGYVLSTAAGETATFGDGKYHNGSAIPENVAGTPTHSTSYTFEGRNDDGTPMRFDACTPVHYVTNVAEGPPGALSFVQLAVSRLQAATGMTFVYDGSTTALPTLSRPAVAGGKWAPVLIGWEHEGQTDYLPAQATLLGMGGFSGVNVGGGTVVAVTGQVALNADLTLSPTTTIPGDWVPGIQHELGHVVGLGHTSDPTQIMAPSFNSQSPQDYSVGDLAGLQAVGVGSPCMAAPAPSAGQRLVWFGPLAGVRR